MVPESQFLEELDLRMLVDKQHVETGASRFTVYCAWAVSKWVAWIHSFQLSEAMVFFPDQLSGLLISHIFESICVHIFQWYLFPTRTL